MVNSFVTTSMRGKKQSSHIYSASQLTMFMMCSNIINIFKAKSFCFHSFKDTQMSDVQNTLCPWLYSWILLFIFLPVWRTEWHKNHMAAISSEKFDSLLKMYPDFYDCKSHMAAFVLIRGKLLVNVQFSIRFVHFTAGFYCFHSRL